MTNYQVDRTKWAKLDIFQQMGNIGSEVGRTFRAKRSGDQAKAQEAKNRALDLFDATSEELAAEHSPRLQEVLLAREQFLAADQPDPALENYFTQFAIAARLRQLS